MLVGNRKRVANWQDAIKVYLDRRQFVIFLMGFSSGLPLLLGFSTLSWWLSSENIPKTLITGLLVVATPYAFKFCWAPILDKIRLPFFTNKLGQRRGWLIFIQLCLISSIIALGASSPKDGLMYMAIMAFLVAFFSASQDIVIDAFRIESAPQRLQGPLSSMYIAGYRFAMLVGGAGSLWLAAFLTLYTGYDYVKKGIDHSFY